MKKILLLLTFLLLLHTSVWGQEDAKRVTPKKPKVGLVLSGGGAKGFAHIGVLKVIDSLNLKVDYVAGTSMGAIIGALYASGYSGKQLDSIFNSVDFDDIINDKIPRGAKSFYERENSEKYAVNLPFDNFKVKLPTALSRGQNVYNLLSKLMLHVGNSDNFKTLPIPFFCMATNIETGDAILLENGYLAQAVAASGALPSLFQPVIINDKVLIDGGVTNNYPIAELRAKGMDVIIGVDVQDGLAKREDLNSAPEILLQINNYRTINDMKVKSKNTDIYIKPDITNFSVMSFDEGRKIIESGEAAARTSMDDLKVLPKLKKPHRLDIEQATKDSITINKIDFKGNERYTRAYLLGKLMLKPYTTVSYADFNRGVNNLVGTNNFDVFQYEFHQSKHNQGYDMEAFLVENNIRTLLRFGIHYDELYKSAALANITRKRLLFDNDVASLDLILGDNVRYNFEYLIDQGFYWSVGLRSRFNQFSKNVSAKLYEYNGNTPIAGLNKLEVSVQDQTNQFYLQTLLNRDIAFSMGLEHKRIKIKSETINNNETNSAILFEKTDYVSGFASLKYDSFSSRYFPKEGFYFNGDFHWYLYASDFNKDFSPFSISKADLGYAISPFHRFSVNILAQGGFRIGENVPPALNFGLGGYGHNLINNFISFYGYDYLTLLGNSFLKTTITLDYEIFRKHHIILAGNIANVEDNLFDTGEWIKKIDYSGLALGYSLETFLGPIEAKYTYSPETRRSLWFFNVGFWF